MSILVMDIIFWTLYILAIVGYGVIYNIRVQRMSFPKAVIYFLKGFFPKEEN